MEPNQTIIQPDWTKFSLSSSDLDFIYNYLLEKETPASTREIAEAMIGERIRVQRNELMKSISELGKIYRPADSYQPGDQVAFPKLANQVGTVIELRKGKNPDLPEFSVAKFRFADGKEKEFAAGVETHALNQLDPLSAFYPDFMDLNGTLKKYGKLILKSLRRDLSRSEELFGMSDYWFPTALLADVNPGFLNLAEAAMEMENGIPLSTAKILEMIEYPSDSNAALTEFSFNYALKQDERFDEVGSLGKILWTLYSLEPEDVRKVPLTLRHRPSAYSTNHEEIELDPTEYQIHDELDEGSLEQPYASPDHFDFCVSYPHWKAGTLPLLGATLDIFPSSTETNHYVFNFVDESTEDTFMGWVIRDENYVCGLKPWYRANKIIPGSVIRIRPGETHDQVLLSKIPPRSSKDWIRTAQFDAKGRLFFETRQQHVSTAFDERLAIHVENTPQLDVLWENHNRQDIQFQRLIRQTFREITRENPQGIIHFSELYAGLNMMHRCAPKELLAALLEDENITPLSNLSFKLNPVEGAEEGGNG